MLPEYFGVFKVHTVGGSKRFSSLFSHGIALEAQWIPISLNGKAALLRRSLTRMICQLIPMCLEPLKPNWVLARILTVSYPVIERSAFAF